MPDQTAPKPDSLRHSTWQLVVLVTFVLTALNFYCFAYRGGFWRDEVDLINLSAENPLTHLRADSFPMLMSLLVHNCLQWVGGDLPLRVLGLLIGLGLIAALWFAGKTLRQSAPLLGLILFGLNATVIAYGQAMRAYGLGMVSIILFLAVMWRFLEKPSTVRLLLLLATAVLSVQSLFQNAVLVAAISAGAWAICWRRKLPGTAFKILLVGLAAAVTLKPYLHIIMASREATVVASTAKANPRTIGDFQPLAELVSFPLKEYCYVWALLLAIIVVAGGLRLRANPRQPTTALPGDGLLFGAVTILASLAGFVWFFGVVATHIQSWHFLPLLAVLACLLDLVFDIGPARTPDLAPLPASPNLGRTVVFGLLAASALVSAAFAQRDLSVSFSNVNAIATRLKNETTPRDYILITPWYFGISYNRYHQSAAPWDTLPPITGHLLHHYDQVQAFMGDSNALRTVEEKITTTLQQGGRVWVAGQLDLPSLERTRPADLPPPPLKKTGWVDTPYNLVWSWQIGWYLTTHATNFGTVINATNGTINQNENLTLVYAEGWRTNAP